MIESNAATPVVIESHYHTPAKEFFGMFPVVIRAGHLQASAGYRVERVRSLGHDLLFCLSGAGHVRVENRTFYVGPGNVVWINGYQPHAHWAAAQNPWQLLWFRMDGGSLEKIGRMLEVRAEPVFTLSRGIVVQRYFRQILKLMSAPVLNKEVTTHAVVSQLLATLFNSRKTLRDPAKSSMPIGFEKALNRMTLYPQQVWTAASLARLSGMSVAQFYRRFRQMTGAAPIDWLRRERISLAQRRLLETDDPIKDVADQAGYNSPFYFSRDFKRYTGLSPSEFRRHDQAAPATNDKKSG